MNKPYISPRRQPPHAASKPTPTCSQHPPTHSTHGSRECCAPQPQIKLTEWIHTSLSSLCSVSHLPAATSSLPSTSASRPFAPAASSGMSRLQGPSSLKRKRPELNSPVQSLTEHERILYDVIRSKQDIGIWTRDMKKEAKLPDNVVNKSLKALQVKNLIKEVVNIQNKGRKHFMATEFEPSKEISGGAWYLEGSLDTEFIESLRQLCKRQIEKKGVATLEEVTDLINSYPAFNVDVTKQQIEEILRTLIWDNAIMEVKSNGMGEFASIPFGKVCYRYVIKGGLGGEPRAGALASIPCGVCPRISHCTPDGVISPKTCVYYQKWLDF
uniref:RNA polymerase III subunit C6 n=1 Tax=Salix viminalis TaxID=40686 RepID=A0A6N2MIX0_SALVM